jgi:hypothetical protein
VIDVGDAVGGGAVRNSVAMGFAPWIVFWVVSSPSTWKWAALAALVVALGVVLPDLGARRGVSTLDGASILFFSVMSVLALVLPLSALAGLERYAQAISMALLAVVAVGGVLVGRPFTAYYARREVPREYWDTPRFRRTNRVISLVWGAAFAVVALAGVAAVRFAVAPDLLQWIVPIVALVAAQRFTEAYTASGDDGTDPGADHSTPTEHPVERTPS